MLRCGHVGDRHLVGAPIPLRLEPVHSLRSGPAFGTAQDDHRPLRADDFLAGPGHLLDRCDFFQHRVEGRRHQLVHRRRDVAFDEMRLVAVAQE